MKAWVGSANWTTNSFQHLEFGTWIIDDTFAETALAYLVDLLSFSEPYDSRAADPNPDLEATEWDDDAFQQAAAEREDWYEE